MEPIKEKRFCAECGEEIFGREDNVLLQQVPEYVQ